MITSIRKYPQTAAADAVRAEARQQAAAEMQTTVVAVRQEFAESLKNARRQSHEQARKFAEETREAARAKATKREL